MYSMNTHTCIHDMWKRANTCFTRRYTCYQNTMKHTHQKLILIIPCQTSFTHTFPSHSSTDSHEMVRGFPSGICIRQSFVESSMRRGSRRQGAKALASVLLLCILQVLSRIVRGAMPSRRILAEIVKKWAYERVSSWRERARFTVHAPERCIAVSSHGRAPRCMR